MALPVRTLSNTNVEHLADHAVLHLKSNQTYDVKVDYGATGDGTTNDRAAVLAAFNAAPDGSTINFPNGTFVNNQSQITLTDRHRLKITGDRGAILKRGASGTGMFKFVECSEIEVCGLTFDGNGSVTFDPQVEFQEVQGGWVHHNRFINTGYPAPVVNDRYAFLTNSIGTSPANADIWFTDNYIKGLQTEFDNIERFYVLNNISEDFVDSAAFGSFLIVNNQVVRDGLYAGNIVINGDEIAFPLVNDNGTRTGCTLERVVVRNNLIYRDAASGPTSWPAIKVGTVDTNAAATSNVFRDIRVEDNDIVYEDGITSTVYAVWFASSTTATIEFERCAVNRNRISSLGTAGGKGMRLQLLQNSECIGNVITGTTDGFIWQSTSGSANQADNVYSDNIIRNVTTLGYTFQNSTGGNKLRRNEIVGTAPSTPWTTSTVHATDIRESPFLTASATWNPASIADGDDLSTTITVTGAAVGDVAYATLSTIGANDVMVSAHVESANTVRVVLLNRRGSAYDIASGTLRVVVLPFV